MRILQNRYVTILWLALAAIGSIFVASTVANLVVSSTSSVVTAERYRAIIWSVGTVAFIILGSVCVGHIAEAIAGWARLSRSEQRKVFWGVTFAAPWIIGFVIFVLGPALASLYYSLTDYKLGETPNFIGLENYRILLSGEGAHGRRFGQSMYNSFYYALVGVPLQIITALAMAMLVNQALRGMRIFRLIFYIPVILAGGAAILLTWRYMLASNGGLINETLKALSASFFATDFLYKGFIFGVEGFNGFYSGLTRGDQVGPLIYTLPALIGAVLLFLSARGDWENSKRDRAWLVAEVIGMVLIFMLFVRALITVPLDWGMVLLAGALAIAGILLNGQRGKKGSLRAWQAFTLIGLLGVLLVILFGDATLSWEQRLPYIIGAAIIGLPVLFSMIGPWSRAKVYALAGGLVLAVAVLFIRDFGAEFGQRTIVPVVKYVFLGTALEPAADLTWLVETFPQSLASALWLWGAVALLLGGLAIANNRWPRAQRWVAIIGALVFGLIAIGSFLDGIRYFQAIEAASLAAGSPTYHFSLFRNATAAWPDSTRVPLWLSSELWSKPSLILITMWSSGAMMLIFLAALKGVSQALYEAAKVDGANRTQRFFKITLPMISPALFYNLVIAIIAALQTFDTIYILQTTQTVDSLQSAVFFLYTRTFRQLAIGQGSAVSWILAGVIVLITVIQFRYSKWVHYEA